MSHSALEKVNEILSPFLFPEQLTIETTECGAVNSYYQRKNFKPTVEELDAGFIDVPIYTHVK